VQDTEVALIPTISAVTLPWVHYSIRRYAFFRQISVGVSNSIKLIQLERPWEDTGVPIDSGRVTKLHYYELSAFCAIAAHVDFQCVIWPAAHHYHTLPFCDTFSATIIQQHSWLTYIKWQYIMQHASEVSIFREKFTYVSSKAGVLLLFKNVYLEFTFVLKSISFSKYGRIPICIIVHWIPLF